MVNFFCFQISTSKLACYQSTMLSLGRATTTVNH